MSGKIKDIFVSLAIICEKDFDVTEKLVFCADYLKNNYAHYEIILIDSGALFCLRESEVNSLLSKISRIRYIRIAAVDSSKILYSAGLENAIGDIIVLTEPQYINEKNLSSSIELCCAGNDVVSGTLEVKQSLLYRLSSCVFRLLFGAMLKYELPPDDAYFRCISRRAANSVMTTSRFQQFLFLRMANTGYKSAVLPIVPEYKNQNKRSLAGAVSQAIAVIVFNSVKPLRYTCIAAVFISCASLCIGIYSLLVHLIKHQVVEGWTTLMLISSSMFFFVFIFIAVFGEYLQRLIMDRDSMPYHVIQEKHSSVMLDFEKLNIRDEATGDYTNLCQTGRDR